MGLNLFTKEIEGSSLTPLTLATSAKARDLRGLIDCYSYFCTTSKCLKSTSQGCLSLLTQQGGLLFLGMRILYQKLLSRLHIFLSEDGVHAENRHDAWVAEGQGQVHSILLVH